MKRILMLIAAAAITGLAGCAVVPVGPPARAYVVAPRVVVAPAPVVVRPYRWYW